MRLGEAVLTKLSRDPSGVDLTSGMSDWTTRDPWANLGVFPGLTSHLKGRDVLDFGCGDGFQAIACLDAGARSVVGVDTNPTPLAVARTLAADRTDRDSIRFVERVDPTADKFDVIISQDSMEHFDNASAILDLWRSIRRPGGRVYVTFGPPWFAPYGAHMHFFTPVPWVHLLLRERTVMKVRARYRNDGAEHYGHVVGGLGKMSVGKFENGVRRSGFRTEWVRHDTVKKLPVSHVPVVRELLTNNIAAVLCLR